MPPRRYASMLTDDEDALVVANIPLVHWTVRKFAGPHEYEDRVQDGMFGLMRAAQLYDPSRGFTFSTYAVPWIRQAVGRGRDAELGLARRAALREGDDWHPPVPLDAAETPDGRPLADNMPSNDDDPADIAERSLAVTAIFAACRDDLDRSVLVAVATGASLRSLDRERHLANSTCHDRLDRIRTTVGGKPPPPPRRRMGKAVCTDCGGPCKKTRCRACYDGWVEAELASVAS